MKTPKELQLIKIFNQLDKQSRESETSRPTYSQCRAAKRSVDRLVKSDSALSTKYLESILRLEFFYKMQMPSAMKLMESKMLDDPKTWMDLFVKNPEFAAHEVIMMRRTYIEELRRFVDPSAKEAGGKKSKRPKDKTKYGIFSTLYEQGKISAYNKVKFLELGLQISEKTYYNYRDKYKEEQ